MLERTKPDILTVATPPDTHFELTRLGLLAGCHVICEKPFVNTLKEADAIIDLSRRVGRHVVVNNQFRFMRIHRAAKEKIGSPDFGRLLFLNMHQTFLVDKHTEAGWRGRDTQRTAKEFGTHALDLCRYFFDEDPISISARMPKCGASDGPDFLNLIDLEFSGDRVAHITLDRVTRGRHRYLDVCLDGEAGSIEATIGGRFAISAGFNARRGWPFFDVDIAPGGRARLYRGERFTLLAREPRNIFAAATKDLVKALLKALSTGESPPCNSADNRRTLALMIAAYESAGKRTPMLMTNNTSVSGD
jgi:predicted dehydrogenase